MTDEGEYATQSPADSSAIAGATEPQPAPSPGQGVQVLDSHRSDIVLSESRGDGSQSEAAQKKERKSVKFADDNSFNHSSPNESLVEHNLRENIFGKIPPELSYLEKRVNVPKALPQTLESQMIAKKNKKALSLDDLPDLPSRAVKEISAVNKNTVLNFNYHEVILPIGPDRILVEVKYSSLFSPDISKLSKYTYNISNERIGIGYDFVGEVVAVGKNYVNSEKFKKGTKVFGITNPLEKKGALQTCVIVNPSDVMIEIGEQELREMELVNINLSSKIASDFNLDESDLDDARRSVSQTGVVNSLNIPPLAKFCTFGSQFCRAKQAVALMDKVFAKQASANILVNGADTLMGKTLVQLIASSVYRETLHTYNVTLIVQERNVQDTKAFISQFNCGGLRNMNVVSYDMENEDLIVPGETLPTNYKKVPFFASEVIESILKIIPESEKIGKHSINQSKLDLFIDIVGSKKMFQKSVDMSKIDQVNFPFKSRLEEGLKPSTMFGKSKEPLFTKLMKPKASGSSFVSFCSFDLSEPSYSIDKMIPYKSLALDPWASSWTRGLANHLVGRYNYYEISNLQIRKEWVEEAYRLVKGGELRMQIDDIVEWRNDFSKRIDHLRRHDGSILFEIESF